MANLSLDSVKQALIDAARFLDARGLLFRGEHANLSARLDAQHIVLTRGGQVGHLTPDSFVVISVQSTGEEGGLDPANAEIVQMHTQVYYARQDVGAIIHCHPPFATAFAVAQQTIPLVYEPLLRFGQAEAVPVAPWAPRGSAASVQGIVDRLQGHPGNQAVLLANHGALAVGKDPGQAARCMATVDEAAQLVIAARQLGGEKPLPAAAFAEVQARIRQFGG